MEGYQKAADQTEESELKTVFDTMAIEAKKNATELLRELNKGR